MHVIVVAIGSRGDIFPFIGLGRALQALGCSVHFITSGNYQTAVTEAGLRYIELCDTTTYEAVRDLLEHMPARRSEMTPMQWEAAHAFLSMTPEGVYRLIEANHVPGKTILAASDMYLNGAGRLAREKLGIPYVAVRHNAGVMHSLSPHLPRAGRAVEMWFRNFALGHHWPMRENKFRYQHLRAELGLASHRNMVEAYWYSEQLNVALFPAWFAPWFRGQLPNTIFTNFPLYETTDAEGLPEKLDSFLNRGLPPLVFTYALVGGLVGGIALVLSGAAIIGTFGVSLVMSQEYMPARVGVASGLSIGFAIGLGGVAAVLLGALADAIDLEAAIVACAVGPALAAALTLLLPPSRRAPRMEPAAAPI